MSEPRRSRRVIDLWSGEPIEASGLAPLTSLPILPITPPPPAIAEVSPPARTAPTRPSAPAREEVPTRPSAPIERATLPAQSAAPVVLSPTSAPPRQPSAALEVGDFPVDFDVEVADPTEWLETRQPQELMSQWALSEVEREAQELEEAREALEARAREEVTRIISTLKERAARELRALASDSALTRALDSLPPLSERAHRTELISASPSPSIPPLASDLISAISPYSEPLTPIPPPSVTLTLREEEDTLPPALPRAPSLTERARARRGEVPEALTPRAWSECGAPAPVRGLWEITPHHLERPLTPPPPPQLSARWVRRGEFERAYGGRRSLQ